MTFLFTFFKFPSRYLPEEPVGIQLDSHENPFQFSPEFPAKYKG